MQCLSEAGSLSFLPIGPRLRCAHLVVRAMGKEAEKQGASSPNIRGDAGKALDWISCRCSKVQSASSHHVLHLHRTALLVRATQRKTVIHVQTWRLVWVVNLSSAEHCVGKPGSCD